eukprot:13386654-Ditylum_brightwellii.AAC.1
MLRIIREHKCIGAADALLYTNVQWAMDNWFTSKPLFDELLQLGQYPLGTMDVKRYAPPYLKHIRTKKPTANVPKGTIQPAHSHNGKLLL